VNAPSTLADADGAIDPGVKSVTGAPAGADEDDPDVEPADVPDCDEVPPALLLL
jgi:hypothetical protein